MRTKRVVAITIILFILVLISLGAVDKTTQASTKANLAPQDIVWPEIALLEYASGLTLPVHVTHAGDGSGRLFVTEQAGKIRIVQGGSLLPTPFLDITDRVRTAGGEEGLLSAAFPPNYAQKGYFYVYYTKLNSDNVVARFRLTADPNQADPASEETILTIPHPGSTNHNGGQLAFGPDGYLYIATGDGGGSGDPQGNAQNLASLLGKILRVDVEFDPLYPDPASIKAFLPVLASNAASVPAYRIPADNPFINSPGAHGEIWDYGLRNPWRFSFDRLTGDLYIGDVGQDAWEEIDQEPATSSGGVNYGWNVMEGNHCYNAVTCDQTGLMLPVAEYPHQIGYSVTGGFVYRGSQYPSLSGFYFFADYVTGQIWGLIHDGVAWQMHSFFDPATGHKISTFGENEGGELFFASRTLGKIYQVVEAVP